ncbi:hypothetical protein CCACVL1_24641 [Corchorus capsularis]|uniref:Uncharacterized protein n=1 Tax=Corchorus capsularis TaxID=210143 RepID=A0A1R3GNR6_COCAP|nr:hypothetical protein CCACVL1_24641 [Corchorus capsularis]
MEPVNFNCKSKVVIRFKHEHASLEIVNCGCCSNPTIEATTLLAKTPVGRDQRTDQRDDAIEIIIPVKIVMKLMDTHLVGESLRERGEQERPHNSVVGS